MYDFRRGTDSPWVVGMASPWSCATTFGFCPCTGDGEDNARLRRRESLKELYIKLEEELKPLVTQLARLKDVSPPEFKTLAEWESRAVAAGRLAGNGDAVLQKASHSQGLTSTPMLLGETKVEVALAGLEAKEETKEEAGGAALKVLPPWMIREGMSLTAQQRGGAKVEPKQEDGIELGGPSVEVREPEDDKDAVQKQIQEEYLKAYYAAYLQRSQQEAEAQAAVESSALAGEQETSTPMTGSDEPQGISSTSRSYCCAGMQLSLLRAKPILSTSPTLIAEQETSTPMTGSDEPQGMDLNEVPNEVAAPADTATVEVDEDEDIDWEEG